MRRRDWIGYRGRGLGISSRNNLLFHGQEADRRYLKSIDLRKVKGLAFISEFSKILL